MKDTTTNAAEISKLIGSSAYQRSSHPDHKVARQTVKDWFALRYGNQPAQTDATGRTISSDIKPVSFLISQIQSGSVLFVGEGNLSFSLSIAELPGTQATKIIATTYEKISGLSDETLANEDKLRQLGASVINGIDATKLDSTVLRQKFDTIVFQFPNAGSRDPKYGRNPNFILIRSFLKSAAHCLAPNGRILITAVDNPHYQGAFQFEEAAEKAGFNILGPYPFDPESFPGYSHTNTNDDESALEKHDEFKTWVFELKR